MKNLKNILLFSLVVSSCSIFSEEDKEKPSITYTNLPAQEVSLNPEDAVTKREEINVPSVSEQIKIASKEKTSETQAEPNEEIKEKVEVLEVTEEDFVNNKSDVTVKRIRVGTETVETETIETGNIVTSKNEPEVITINKTTVASTPVTTEMKSEDYGSEDQPSSDAEVGQCYGKVRIAGTFKEVEEKVVVEPEKVKKQTIPAKYNYVDEEVIIREQTVKFVEIPATYKIATENIVIEPEKKQIVTIPAKYKTVKERVMVKPAAKVWKKGRGLIEKVGGDGEIMCLVEEPAEYEMVEKKVVIEPERQEVKIIPAVTKIITKEVIDQPAKVEKRVVPAVKKTITKKVLVQPEKTIDVKVPAKYKIVKKKVAVTPSKVVWRPVLCDYNITKDVIMKIQESLSLRGFDTGGVDGVFGSKTSAAVKEFQKSLGFQSGGITLETLRALGVSY